MGQKLGLNGTRKRGIRITRSLRMFWDTFRLLTRREALTHIDCAVNCDAVNTGRPCRPGATSLRRCLLADITAVHRRGFRILRAIFREKGDSLYDLRPTQGTVRADTRYSREDLQTGSLNWVFKLGEIRAHMVLFLLHLATAGSRPNAILKTRNEDIGIALQ